MSLRHQLRRNQLACLLLAQGVPLILAGDEVGNTQYGNNNAYCQDNEIGWVKWDGLGREGDDLIDFIGHLTALRRAFPQLRTSHWIDGRRADGSYGALWLKPDATEMTEHDWSFPEGRFLAYVLGPVEEGGAPIFIVLNAAPDAIPFTLPKIAEYGTWTQVLNTVETVQGSLEMNSGAVTDAPARSVIAFAGKA
jgi:glycogen operon protein